MKNVKDNSEVSYPEFFKDYSPYKKVICDKNDLFELQHGEIQFDCYCNQCKQICLFKSPKSMYYNIEIMNSKNAAAATPPVNPSGSLNYSIGFYPSDRIQKRCEDCNKNIPEDYFVRTFECTRNAEHQIIFLIKYDKQKCCLFKIGQYPSLSDQLEPQSKKYGKVLAEDSIADLLKASRLYDEGIGAGAYVYLRRVFEKIVNQTYEDEVEAGRVEKVDRFIDKLMDEKLDLLKEALPDFMTSNTQIYGILSSGIHFLDEEYCLNKFSIMRESIYFILDDKISKRDKISRQKRQADLLGTVCGEVRDQKRNLSKTENKSKTT